jgi:hypothetical protein
MIGPALEEFAGEFGDKFPDLNAGRFTRRFA